ncbi:MAG: AAA family ATPase [Actinobacteria bacterium]|nr:AAA family ATPase [Actinomycetota bacterium]
MPPKRLNPREFLSTTRLVVVAGKGGVGKTTVTAVLARAAADAGLRVLAVDLDGKPTLADLVGDVPHLSLTAPDALAEYLETHGLKRVAKRLAASGIIDVVSTAAPGIDDIVVLGKLKSLERSGDHDLIVVDGPAAGHAITFLLSARGLLDTVRGGPIRTQALEVLEMLGDPARCQVVLVTLPETTPVNELVETAYALEEQVGVQLGPVVVNGVDGSDESDGSDRGHGSGDLTIPDGTDPALAAAAAFRNARRAMHRREIERLSDALAIDQIHLPHVVTAGITRDDVARLAAGL